MRLWYGRHVNSSARLMLHAFAGRFSFSAYDCARMLGVPKGPLLASRTAPTCAREGWCMREPFLRIGSAAVFALGFALAGLSVANAESVMKECGADWQAAKAAGTTNGQTWQEFLAKDIPAYPYCSAALCMVQSMNRRGFGGGGAMARNLVQFQKGLSEQEFDRL